jgi:hypothetical protein
VDVMADGNTVFATGTTRHVVASGAITLQVAASVVHVGLRYDSELQPMRIDTDPQQGNGQGLIKRIHHLALRFMDTGGAKVAKTPTDAAPVTVRMPASIVDGVLLSGDVEHPCAGDYDEDATFVIQSLGPQPLTVLGVFVKYTVTENP